MSNLSHPNVLRLLGMHRPTAPVMLVHEETENGGLAKYAAVVNMCWLLG